MTTSFGAYKHVFIIGVDGGGASFVEWNPINIGIVENGFNITKVTGSDDKNVAERVIDYLTDNTPTLMFVQFSEPDKIGEKYGFGTDLHLASISFNRQVHR